MNKKIVLSSTIVIIANSAFAQTDTSYIISNNIIALIALVVAVAAFVMAAINAYNISHNRKVRDVNLVNQQDDINVTIDAMKVSLSKDIRSVKRDLNKMGRSSKPKTTSVKENSEVPETEQPDADKPKVKKPFKKRKPFRKKPVAKDESASNNEVKNDN